MNTPAAPQPEGIDRQDARSAAGGAPYNLASFEQIRILAAWSHYRDKLEWGRGQCLAILDDGCKLDDPAWKAALPWGPKVIATWNSIDGNADANPVPPGYHGTSVGYPSSMNLNGILGAAYNNQVAQVRCVTIVHLKGRGEAGTMAAGLRWVLENADRLNITAVNLSPLDDERHAEPVPTAVDEPLRQLRDRGIWVGAPCGNHHYTDGISWPACQPHCFAIGGTKPGAHEAHLDRFHNTDLLVCATATSSSNAYAAACAQILREAIVKTGYAWSRHGDNLADAMMALFQQTGGPIDDPASGCSFRELDLLAALNHVFGASSDDPQRRAFWTRRMDEGYAFMLKITGFPVAENGEPLVSLRDAAADAGAEVVFSDTPLSEGLARRFFLRRGLIPSFIAAALALNRQGLILKVEDAYRDRPMQKSLALKPSLLQKIGPRLLWECGGAMPDSGFIGRRLAALIAHCPKTGTHMSGSALDISVLKRADGSELDRGAPYLEMSELTPMDSPFVSAEAQKNRRHITGLMREHGFVEYPFEFWHYSSGDAIAMLVADEPGPARYGAVDLAPDGRTTPLANPLESLNSLDSLAAALEAVMQKGRK